MWTSRRRHVKYKHTAKIEGTQPVSEVDNFYRKVSMWGFCSLTEAGSRKVSAGISWFLLRQKDAHSLWGSASTAPRVASHQQERSQIPAPALQQKSCRPTPLLPKCQDHITASNGVRRISSECHLVLHQNRMDWKVTGARDHHKICHMYRIRGHPRIPSPKCLQSHHLPSPGRSRPLGKGHLISPNPGILGHGLSSDVCVWAPGCGSTTKWSSSRATFCKRNRMVTASSSSSLPRLLGLCFSDHPRRDDGQYTRISKLLLMTVTCSDVGAMVPDGALKMVLTHRRKRNNEILSY